MPDRQRLTLALIGAGGMGQRLAQTASTLPSCEVAFVCEPDEQRACEVAHALEAEISWPVEELLAHDDLDGVIIAAPNHLHAQLSIAAGEAGKHIFCEKPMALSVADAQRMIEAAEANGVKLMIGQVLRYILPFVWIREFITEGNLGEPFGMQVTRIGGPWRSSEEVPWRLRRDQCGGPLFEIGAHEIDFIRCLLGQATSVYARLGHFLPSEFDYEDFAQVIINFDDGKVAHLLEGHASHMAIYEGKIFCTAGTVAFSNWGDYLAYQRPDDAEPVIVNRGELTDKYEEAFHRELREFVEAIRNDTAPPIPGLEGLRNVEIAQAGRLSEERGEPVSLPL